MGCAKIAPPIKPLIFRARGALMDVKNHILSINTQRGPWVFLQSLASALRKRKSQMKGEKWKEKMGRKNDGRERRVWRKSEAEKVREDGEERRAEAEQEDWQTELPPRVLL